MGVRKEKAYSVWGAREQVSSLTLLWLWVLCLTRPCSGQEDTTPEQVRRPPGVPHLTDRPHNETITKGTRMVFNCRAEAFPEGIRYEWFKDGRSIQGSESDRAQRIQMQEQGNLLFTTTIRSDSGKYTCVAGNNNGKVEASAWLTIVYKPIVLKVDRSVVWVKNYPQRLDCPVDANPPVTSIVWVKENLQIRNQGRFDILINGTLRVSNVQDSDAGSYTCTPYNLMGAGVTSPRIQVDVRDPPSFMTRPKPVYMGTVGGNVTFLCQGQGNPEVITTWVKVRGFFNPILDSRITMADSYLQIRNLRKEDNGKYECKASNAVATMVAPTELRIGNTTPHAPYNMSLVPGQFNVTIFWEPAYSGARFLKYVLWFRKKSVHGSNWQTMGFDGDSSTRRYTLMSLQPSTTYEFKLLARNEKGDGSFSDTLEQTTLGYDPQAVQTLPTDANGRPYYPKIVKNVGPPPAAPGNVSAHVKGRDIVVMWDPPRRSTVPIFSYVVEYSKDGGPAIEYKERVKGENNRTIILTDMKPGTYTLWVRSHGNMAISDNSATVQTTVASREDVVLPEALVGGIVGGILFLLVAVLLALVAIFHSRKKERRTKDKKYNDVTYGQPDEIDSRHHEFVAKRDRWQQNGGGRGDFVTALNNTDSIFFLPQSRALDQKTDMQATLHSGGGRDWSQRGVGGSRPTRHDDDYRDYGRQVPSVTSAGGKTWSYPPAAGREDEAEDNGFSTRWPRDSRKTPDPSNQTWPEEHLAGQPGRGHDDHQHQTLSRSLPPGYGLYPGDTAAHVDSYPPILYPRVSQRLPPAYKPRRDDHHPPLGKSHSYPSQGVELDPDFPSLLPISHSSHLPLNTTSPLPHKHSHSHLAHPSSSSSSSSHHNLHPINPQQQQQLPSFQNEDDDEVFSTLPAHQRTPPVFPRHSSMKPGQMTYLMDSHDNHNCPVGSQPQNPQSLFDLGDISSVLERSSERPSQRDTDHSFSSPLLAVRTQLPFADGEAEEEKNIPGYYFGTGDPSPLVMVTPYQEAFRDVGDNDGTASSGRPLGYSRDHLQGVDQRLREAQPHSREAPPLFNQTGYSDAFPQSRDDLHDLRLPPPVASRSHSTLPPPPQLDYHHRYHPPSSGVDDDSLQRRNDPGSRPVDDDNNTSFVSGLRPRALSEGSQGRGFSGPKFYDDNNDGCYVNGMPEGYGSYPNNRRPDFAASHSDMSLPQSGTSTAGYPLDQGYPPTQGELYGSESNAPFVPGRYGRDPYSTRSYDNPHSGYPTHPPLSHYGEEAVPTDTTSHSSGIGSRNTSQSTGSSQPRRSKGSNSFSSAQDPDLSLDTIGGVGLALGNEQPPLQHRRDTSADENYEFDSLNAIENDIIDDLRRYSQISGNSAAPPPSGLSPHHVTHHYPEEEDPNSYSLPIKRSRYPNSEQRFKRLREEFKQYRQDQSPHQSGGIPLPPTASTALPIGVNGEPLYPMDSEML